MLVMPIFKGMPLYGRPSKSRVFTSRFSSMGCFIFMRDGNYIQ